MTAPAALSAIIPARNASATLGACIEAVLAQAGADVEVIVVDDASEDATAEVAALHPVRLLRLPERRGAAGARNAGAASAGAGILLFLDADVVLGRGALARCRAAFLDGTIDAIIGSYDDDPPVRSIVSLFKNLAHHHFHQRSAGPSTGFWGACGAIRRETFFAVGGFDERRFRAPAIEDVELGYRLTRGGARIRLDPELQVKHLKRWTLASLVATDVLRRAVPWTVLALESRRLPRGSNFSLDQWIAAPIALVFVSAAVGSLLWPAVAWLVLAAAAVAGWVNRDLYRLLARKGGVRLALGGFLLQQLYYCYAAAGVGAGALIYTARRGRADAPLS